MGADCSSERAPPPRSVRPSPVVSSVGLQGGNGHRGKAARQRTKANGGGKTRQRVEDEFNFNFEFDYDLESLHSVHKAANRARANRNINTNAAGNARVNGKAQAGNEHAKAAGAAKKTGGGVAGSNVSSAPASLSSSSAESGCSGNHSFAGFIPIRKMDEWFKTLPTEAAEFRPIHEEVVWSDGGREAMQWLQTEATSYFYNDDGGVDGEAPSYVLAAGLESEGEREEAEYAKQLQLQRKQRRRKEREKQKLKDAKKGKKDKKADNKADVSRCA